MKWFWVVIGVIIAIVIVIIASWYFRIDTIGFLFRVLIITGTMIAIGYILNELIHVHDPPSLYR